MLCALMTLATVNNMAIDAPVRKGHSVDYKDGDFACEGYVSAPAVGGKHPLVVIVHQWAGLTDYEKMRADMLADLGYIAFAVDIYGKGNRPTGNDRGTYAGKYKGDRALYRQRLMAGLKAAESQPGVDTSKVAAIGYCFGGTGVLELARAGADIKGVVSFHGGLDSTNKEDGKNIKCKVLICHGADDPTMTRQQIDDCIGELNYGKVDWQMISYSGTVHAFTQPDAGPGPGAVAYNAESDKRSWQSMQDFLHELFK